MEPATFFTPDPGLVFAHELNLMSTSSDATGHAVESVNPRISFHCDASESAPNVVMCVG